MTACRCGDVAAGDQSLNAWNVPRHDHRQHLQARELLVQAGTLVHDLVQSLASFYSHSERRVGVFADAVGENVSDVNKKVEWFLITLTLICLQCFDVVVRVAGRASGLYRTEWWGAGVVICLEQGAVLHVAQLMPLPLTVSCFSKIQIGFTFLVPGSSGKGPLNGCVCVCVRYSTMRDAILTCARKLT